MCHRNMQVAGSSKLFSWRRLGKKRDRIERKEERKAKTNKPKTNESSGRVRRPFVQTGEPEDFPGRVPRIQCHDQVDDVVELAEQDIGRPHFVNGHGKV